MVSEVQESSQVCILGISIHVCWIDEREMIPLVELVSTRYIPVVLSGPVLNLLYQVTYTRGSTGHVPGADTEKP